MFIVRAKGWKLFCPFTNAHCKGRNCMAWKPAEEGHPAFEMTRCIDFLEDKKQCQPGRCSECSCRPGRCVLLYPTDPYEAGLKTEG